MRSASWSGPGAIVGAGLIAVSGCSIVLGVDKDFRVGAGGGDGASASGTGGTSATGQSSSGNGPATSTSTVSATTGAGGSGPSVPASCQVPLDTCGPDGNEDCCASPLVPGGTYLRNNDPGTPATVSDFRLDRFEVTVGRFRAFLDAYPATIPQEGDGENPKIPNSGWRAAWPALKDPASLVAEAKCDAAHQTWIDASGPDDNRPMNCVSWYTAFAFCAWDGGRLPTEWEWELAATGGIQGTQYPWSTPDDPMTIDDTYAIYKSNTTFGTLVGVGSRSPKGDGPLHHADMAGGVAELCLDARDAMFPPTCSTDCAALDDSITLRTPRGGCYENSAPNVTARVRAFVVDGPAARGQVGFRCARSP